MTNRSSWFKACYSVTSSALCRTVQLKSTRKDMTTSGDAAMFGRIANSAKDLHPRICINENNYLSIKYFKEWKDSSCTCMCKMHPNIAVLPF